MKLLFFLAAWKRPEITEICFMGLSRLKKTGLFPMEFLAVISEESMIPLCEQYGVKWCMHQNLPLGAKKNFGLSEALKLDWDYIIELGSDDLLKNEVLELYAPFFGHKDYITMDSLVFLNSETGSCRWIKSGSLFGLGRCLSRRVIEEHPKLYADRLNMGLDKNVCFYLARNKILAAIVRGNKPLGIDIKSKVNIWNYNPSLGAKCSFDLAVDGLSGQEIDSIKSLIHVTV